MKKGQQWELMKRMCYQLGSQGGVDEGKFNKWITLMQ
jgi:hypothetical protein